MTANVLEHRRARAFADAVEDRPSTTEAAPAEGQFGELLAYCNERAIDFLSTPFGPSQADLLDATVTCAVCPGRVR